MSNGIPEVGEVAWHGDKAYSTCFYCEKLVRLNKSGFGSMHVCLSPEMRAALEAGEVLREVPKNARVLRVTCSRSTPGRKMIQDNKKYTWATPFSVEDWQSLLELNVERIWEFETVSFRKPRYNSC